METLLFSPFAKGTQGSVSKKGTKLRNLYQSQH